ncbi:MAG: thioesterase family protein [Candidatus Binatia bacterium]
MPVSEFDVRIYDLDAFGDLRTHVLLRFLWQAASEASAAAGFDVDWYERHGTLWVIRRTQLEVHRPIAHREQLRVHTEVVDIRRVRSQRAYAVRRTDDEAVVAEAITDWVYVDLARRGLAQPPPAMQQAFMPRGVVSRARPASLASAPPASAWRGTRKVELADLDTVAHVNNTRYAVFVEQAVWDALQAHGWTVDPTARGARLRLASHDLEYFDPARYGETIATAVWVSARADYAFTTECQLAGPRGLLLHARSTWRWTDSDVPQVLRRAVERLSAA